MIALLAADIGVGLTVKEVLAIVGVGSSILGGGGLAAWFLARSQSAKYLTDAAQTLVQLYQKHASDLEAKLDRSEAECHRKMDSLREELAKEVERAVATYILRQQDRNR